MVDLTPEIREEIERKMELVRPTLNAPQVSVTLPAAPDGRNASKDLDNAISDEANPDKHETKRVKRKIRGLWKNWRKTTLDAKSLDIEKIACQIAIERAETKQKLKRIKQEEELAKVNHWLALNKGNLEEVSMNTTSKPSKFWYSFRRGFHHITKLTSSVPKIIKNLFWIGAIIIGLVILKNFNVL